MMHNVQCHEFMMQDESGSTSCNGFVPAVNIYQNCLHYPSIVIISMFSISVSKLFTYVYYHETDYLDYDTKYELGMFGVRKHSKSLFKQ